ncbi:hypothetical protein [Niveispirillum lacus]|nr:hypothetical protein [Niveispirillum lacus]
MMGVPGFNRRQFMQATALTALATGAAGGSVQAKPSAPDTPIGWIDGTAPARHLGQTWGVPWPQGLYRPAQRFRLTDGSGVAVPVQSWPLATWPDGSLKWSAHSIAAGAGPSGLTLSAGKAAAPAEPVKVTEGAEAITISTGPRQWRIPVRGDRLIDSATVNGQTILRDLRLVCLSQDQSDLTEAQTVSQRRSIGTVTAITVEQRGPVRAVVKLEGSHEDGERSWLPFTVRLYFYAGAESVRIVHSFIFDGDEKKDFIRGLGVTASVAMSDAPHDRHVRFTGEGDGLWAEAIRPLTGLRRDPGKDYRQAQIDGRAIPPLSGMAETVSKRLDLIPTWGDFTLSQANADGFAIRKRTKPGHGWIDAQSGRRAGGLAYIGGAAGGAAVAMADFWKRHPARLDVRNAATETAELTAWLWSPDAPAMDLRFYHDGLGIKTHAQEREALEITYEDYEEGWGRPYGIARTTELHLWSLPATPSRDWFTHVAGILNAPPRLMAPPARLRAVPIFGDWDLVSRLTPARTRIEDQADFLLALYRDQVEQRRWYGFWHYGDVMHSYDSDRHEWRYDIGGYAWANSELSPDLWLWYSFLRTGRADIFRLAEAMTRHTGEVDVCHIGPFKGFGTRHGVQHWADSSKQPRVSNAAYRRIYYYLTADERVGDLMRDLVDSDQTLARVDISRKLPNPTPPGVIEAGFGTTWSSLVAAWLTEWERTGDKRWRDRIVNGMRSIAALQHRWLAGGAPYDLETGKFSGPGDRIGISHLSAVFGAVEIHAELLALLDVPDYRAAWLEYCTFYNAPAAEFRARFGQDVRGRGLRLAHSRLTAYAAHHLNDPALASRAWTEFFDKGEQIGGTRTPITGNMVLNPVDEVAGMSTNGVSQWGLAAYQNLALIGDALPAE